MSAETLRRAAEKMRVENDRRRVTSDPRWLPVAALLLNTADCHLPEGVPGKEPYRCTTCGWGWPCDVQDDALAVARAYLGGAA